MELNADFTKRVAVHAAQLKWVASPMAGVERRMLDRIGDEVARATSIVRYAPNSHFSPHTHEEGEEFLVIDGVFEDEHGHFPAGSYIRNPPQSRHTPGSASGCTIFVKLRQFDPADRTHVRIDTNRLEMSDAAGRRGVKAAALFHDRREDVRLEQWSPGVTVALAPEGGMEILVLEGSFRSAGQKFQPQSWLRLPIGDRVMAIAGPEGCRIWVKEGHLRFVPLPQR
jgi:quercetin dioxygenase-like cupin family protein